MLRSVGATCDSSMTAPSAQQMADAPYQLDRSLPRHLLCNFELEAERHMRVRRSGRRRFITLLAGVVVWPVTGYAQQLERVRRVGVLLPYPENDPLTRPIVTAFTQALGRLGWTDGKNIRIYYRFAAGNPALFKTYAAELVGLSPDVILGSVSPAVAALRQETPTIPIVFVLVADPVGLGFVQSLARPGGNITGFSAFDAPLWGKLLGLFKQIAPGVTRVAVVFNPDTAPFAPLFNNAIEAAAPSFGMTVTLAPVHNDAEIEQAIATQAREPGGGLLDLPESFSVTHRDVIIAAATQHGLPLVGGTEVFPRSGGLMSYWFDTVDVHAQSASYIDRILRGASPADLPVQQPTKFSLIINLKTAKALGLDVPPVILSMADELIE
jgi:putative tryptophan/tyrosine transport system substrate-binding protein